MRDLLLEVGVEELPARFVADASRQLARGVERALDASRLGCAGVRAYATPRRLAVVATGVPERQSEREHLVRGPARRVGLGEDGKPTKAAEGFARAQGVRPEDLVVRAGPEGEYLYAVKKEPARDAAEVLPEALAAAIRGVTFPKSMRWTLGDFRFSRPIRWLVALFGEDVLPVRLGDGLEAGRVSRGHRLAHPEPVPIASPEDFERALWEAQVIADPEARRRMVVEEIEGAAERNGGRALATPELIDEITNLVEYPLALVGRFDPAYLELPREVLMTTMAAHQRYVAVAEDADGPAGATGPKLLPMFVVVANGPHIDQGLVREGNERVLAARLADARFFYGEDTKRPLAERVEALKGVVFHERLGTLWERTERLVLLSAELARRLGASEEERRHLERAARLSKADLVTHMVFELPELQGIMGREYALRAGEHPAVAVALAEQYLPKGAGAEMPSTTVGALLGLADRMDAIVGFFGVGLTPSGSEDPFALRRHATGIVRIALAREWRFSLGETIAYGAKAYGDRLSSAGEELVAGVREFILQRLRGALSDEGLAPDVVEAALGASRDDIVDAARRARALAQARQAPFFSDAVVAFQRPYNLARSRMGSGEIDGSLLAEPSEKALVEALDAVVPEARRAAERGAYVEAIRVLAGMRPAIDRFFEDVLVMAPDERVRANRLQICSRIVRAFAQVADFGALAV